MRIQNRPSIERATFYRDSLRRAPRWGLACSCSCSPSAFRECRCRRVVAASSSGVSTMRGRSVSDDCTAAHAHGYLLCWPNVGIRLASLRNAECNAAHPAGTPHTAHPARLCDSRRGGNGQGGAQANTRERATANASIFINRLHIAHAALDAERAPHTGCSIVYASQAALCATLQILLHVAQLLHTLHTHTHFMRCRQRRHGETVASASSGVRGVRVAATRR